MNIIYYKRLVIKYFFTLTLLPVLLLTGCDDDFLVKNPTTSVSEAIFWKNETEAKMALVGCYASCENAFGWSPKTADIHYRTDYVRQKAIDDWALGIDYTPSYSGDIFCIWADNYRIIARCNYFLENIEKVGMEATTKDEMIGEVKFLRGYSYFLLSNFYGDVPLIEKILTFEETKNVKRTKRENVVNFVIDELTAAAEILPVRASQTGRAEKGAALCAKGRLLMAEKRWQEAALTYKQIIDLDRYIIDPRYKELFLEEGDNSDEIIFAIQFLENNPGNDVWSQLEAPMFYGGFQEHNIFQNFIDKFWMIDGKSIYESSLFNPNNEFENRDPRLYTTVFLPGYTEFRGKKYQAHPDSTDFHIGLNTYIGFTGYSQKKFYDENNTVRRYGGDWKIMRYAEVLLSYLESKLEAGDEITQKLLDETINRIRTREAVNMPLVTELNREKLREIVRNERTVELGLEDWIRYFDIKRWGIAEEVLNQSFYGMKLTNDPGNYTDFPVNNKGYYYSCEKHFDTYNYIWPIPQREMDINLNFEQNPGYN